MLPVARFVRRRGFTLDDSGPILTRALAVEQHRGTIGVLWTLREDLRAAPILKLQVHEVKCNKGSSLLAGRRASVAKPM